MVAHRLTANAYKTIQRLARATGIGRWPLPGRRTVGEVLGRTVRRRVAALGVAGRPVVVRGHRMLLPRNCELAAWFLTDAFEPGTTALLEQSLDEGMIVVDGGANVGYYTMLAARRVGRSGRVYAFEPQSDNFALLVKNVELNGYGNVIPVKKALGARSGKVALHLDGSAQHSLYPIASSGGSELVEAVSLDEFLESEGWPDVDLVKLDLEGGEPAAVEGMRGLLGRSNKVRLVLELDLPHLKRARVDAVPFLQQLHSLGFEVTLLDNGRRLLDRREQLPLDATRVLSELRDEAINLLCQRQSQVALGEHRRDRSSQAGRVLEVWR